MVDIQAVMTEKVRRAMKEMQWGKATVENWITPDHLKDFGPIVVEKLANLHTECLMTASVR